MKFVLLLTFFILASVDASVLIRPDVVINTADLCILIPTQRLYNGMLP